MPRCSTTVTKTSSCRRLSMDASHLIVYDLHQKNYLHYGRTLSTLRPGSIESHPNRPRGQCAMPSLLLSCRKNGVCMNAPHPALGVRAAGFTLALTAFLLAC